MDDDERYSVEHLMEFTGEFAKGKIIQGQTNDAAAKTISETPCHNLFYS